MKLDYKSIYNYNYIRTLLNIDIITSDQNGRELIESHFRSLKALGVNHGTYGMMLSPFLLNTELHLNVSRQVPDSH